MNNNDPPTESPRYGKRNGFIQPRLIPTLSGDEVTSVTIKYATDFPMQMLDYGKQYSLLPIGGPTP